MAARTDSEPADPVAFWGRYQAVLFDLDGVLTPTADLHRHAWTEMFNAFLDAELGPGHAPYTDDDYLAYVDGRPRFDGVRTFLAARGIDLPEGSDTDPPSAHTVGGLGNRKNATFRQLLATRGIVPYPGSLGVLDLLDRLGIASAVVSSSRNARDVLAAAGLLERFPVVVDGAVAEAKDIAGKPAPDMFLEAAAELGVPPERSVVVEDALSGVAAGAAGGFGLVIGVDRGAGRDPLVAHGAGVVVADLAELAPDGRSP